MDFIYLQALNTFSIFNIMQPAPGNSSNSDFLVLMNCAFLEHRIRIHQANQSLTFEFDNPLRTKLNHRAVTSKFETETNFQKFFLSTRTMCSTAFHGFYNYIALGEHKKQHGYEQLSTESITVFFPKLQ